MSKNVVVQDNTSAFKRMVASRTEVGLRMIAERAVEVSKPLTPIKSGDLRRNVSVRVRQNQAEITWEREYAAAQETGQTRGRKITKYSSAGTGKGFAKKGVESAVKRSGAIMRSAMGN